jgi:hypothetical protein
MTHTVVETAAAPGPVTGVDRRAEPDRHRIQPPVPKERAEALAAVGLPLTDGELSFTASG